MAQVGDEIDRLSGHSIASLNKALHEHLDEGGFQIMDDLSKQIFPSVFGAIKNCLYKPLGNTLCTRKWSLSGLAVRQKE